MNVMIKPIRIYANLLGDRWNDDGDDMITQNDVTGKHKEMSVT